MPSFRVSVPPALLALPFVLLLTLATTASATIVVGQSIDGIKFGQSEAEVQQALGTPTCKMPEGSSSSWCYPTGLMGRVGFDAGGQVSSIWTSSRAQKTNKGIGPGSSLTKLRQVYPKAKCSTGHLGPKSVVCVLKSTLGGKPVETSFPFVSRTAGLREVDIEYA
jgi:hypothetical protein